MEDERLAKQLDDILASNGSRDQVLRDAVRLIKDMRPEYNWAGVYLLEGDTLVLHNYIGPPTEHTRIPVGRGVCGAAVLEGSNQIVGDVTARDNYLACSLETRSEIVVLIRRGDLILGQIDIDSDRENAFDDRDERLLTLVADRLATII